MNIGRMFSNDINNIHVIYITKDWTIHFTSFAYLFTARHTNVIKTIISWRSSE